MGDRSLRYWKCYHLALKCSDAPRLKVLKTKINLIAEHTNVLSFKMLRRPVAERISLLFV